MQPVIKRWAIDKIKPYEENAKLHDKAQVSKIAKSIAEFGWTSPIVVDKNGVIIAGHGRRLAAIELKQTEVPVLVRDDLTDDQVRALRLADNRVAIGGFDNELMRKELESIEFDLNGIFDKKELAFLTADMTEINMDGFVDDLDAAVDRQTEETKATVAAIDKKDVPIAKALGFKTITLKDEKHVAAFLAQIESDTGKQGADAFIEHTKRHVATA